jgi:hypothetical protein
MVRAIVCSLVIVLLVCLGAAASTADDKTPDSSRHDPRLDQLVNISVAYDSLQEFCARLRGLTEGAIQSAETAPDEANGRPQRAAPTSETDLALAEGPDGSGSGNGRAPGAGAGSPDPAESSRDQEIARPVAVDVSCDPAIKEHKVVVHVHDQPLREVMRQIAVLFDFTWMQGPQEHPRYQLTQSNARGKLGESLRRRYLAEREGRDRRIFRDALRALKADPDELYELAQQDPEAIALVTTARDHAQILGALTESSLETVLDGRVVALSLAQLAPEVQAQVQKECIDPRRWHGPKTPAAQDFAWDVAELRFVRSDWRYTSVWSCMIVPWVAAPYLDSSSGARRLEQVQLDPLIALPWTTHAARLADFENTGYEFARERYDRVRQLETDFGIKVVDKARGEATEGIPEWARDKADHGALRASGESRPLKSKHWDLVFSLPKLLAEAAEALDINLIADCHWTHTSREWFTEQGDQGYTLVYPVAREADDPCTIDSNPEYTLNRICEQRGRSWAKDGEFFRVRNLLWFVDDPEEVPASVLNEWMRRTKRETQVTVEDYVYLADSVTEKLARNIDETSYRGAPNGTYIGFPLKDASAISRAYYPMKLYSMLSPRLRPTLSTRGIGLADELPEDLMPLIQRAFEAEQSVRAGAYGWLPQDKIEGLRLWAGNRPGSLAGEGRFHLGFCIELWSGAEPNWNDAKKDGGRIRIWDYPLEPNNIPGVDPHY